MKSRLSYILPVFVALVALTSGCRPFSNSKKEVTFSYVPIPFLQEEDSVTTIADTHTWRTPLAIDSTVVTGASIASPYDTTTGSGYGHTNNIYVDGFPAGLLLLPVAGGFDAYDRGYAGLSSFDLTAPDDPTAPIANLRYQMVISSASNFSSGVWASSTEFNSFQTVGAGIPGVAVASGGALAPAGGVHLSFAAPSSGDLHAFLIKETFLTGGIGRGALYGTRRYPSPSYEYDAWQSPASPSRLSPLTNSIYINRIVDGQCVPRTATYSSGLVLLAWCGTDTAPGDSYFLNVYTPSSAFSGSWSGASVLLDSTNGATIAGVTSGDFKPGNGILGAQNLAAADNAGGLGIDVAMNSAGAGIVAYVALHSGSDTTVLYAQNYSVTTGLSSTRNVLATYTSGTGVSKFSQPRVWVREDGSAVVFYYRYDGTSTELYAVNRASTSSDGTIGTWSAAVRMDSPTWASIIPSFNYEPTQTYWRIHAPALAFARNYAVVGYVQPDTLGGIPRFRVRTYDPSRGAWNDPQTVDESWNSDGVGQYFISGAPDPNDSNAALFMTAFEGLTSGIPTSVQARMYSTKRAGFTPQAKVSSTLNALYSDPTTAINSRGLGSVFFHALPDTSDLTRFYHRAYSAAYR